VKHRRLNFVLSFLVASSIGTGCSSGFEASKGLSVSGSTTISDEVSVNVDQLSTVKDLKLSGIEEVEFSDEISKEYLHWENEFLSSGIVLTALIYKACLENGGDELSNRILKSHQSISQLQQRIVAVNFQLAEKTSLAAIASASKASACVLKIENEMKVEIEVSSNDTESSKQDYLDQINWLEGVELLDHKPGDKSVVVAVVDSGIDYNHEDLSAVMWKDSEGRFGYDFFDRDYDPRDEGFHGTYVAGIIAAHTNNKRGIAGVAPAGVKIMALKTTGKTGLATITTLVNSIYYALGNGADVINISMSVKFDSDILEIALQDAVKQNVLVVVSAGNDSLPLANVYDKKVTDKVFVGPASYSSQMLGILSVGAKLKNMPPQ
jgi:subtilisin family serine protease